VYLDSERSSYVVKGKRGDMGGRDYQKNRMSMDSKTKIIQLKRWGRSNVEKSEKKPGTEKKKTVTGTRKTKRKNRN